MCSPDGAEDSTRPASLSALIEHWPTAEPAALEWIHREYFRRLAALSRRVLGSLPGARTEAEDVVQSALGSLCRFMRRQESTSGKDRDDIWRLLCHIVARKSQRRVRRQTRGLPGGRVHPATDVSTDDEQDLLHRIIDKLSADEFDRVIVETLEPLELPLQQIALLAIEGHTQAEIARRLGCSQRTIIRKMEIIRCSVLREEL